MVIDDSCLLWLCFVLLVEKTVVETDPFVVGCVISSLGAGIYAVLAMFLSYFSFCFSCYQYDCLTLNIIAVLTVSFLFFDVVVVVVGVRFGGPDQWFCKVVGDKIAGQCPVKEFGLHQWWWKGLPAGIAMSDCKKLCNSNPSWKIEENTNGFTWICLPEIWRCLLAVLCLPLGPDHWLHHNGSLGEWPTRSASTVMKSLHLLYLSTWCWFLYWLSSSKMEKWLNCYSPNLILVINCRWYLINQWFRMINHYISENHWS